MATIIHIGYQRTGTSFLQKFIFPQCQKHSFHGHVEMLKYGLIDVAWRADRSIDYDHLIATYRVKEDHIISLESFIGPVREGSTLIDVIPFRLKQIFGDKTVKILITIRKQDEWLKSYYAQWIASGGTMKFLYFISNKLGGHRFDPKTLDYLTTYMTYVKVFGEENVLVLPQELMKNNQTSFLTVLNEFTGESFSKVEKKGKAINRSLSGFQLKWMRFLNRIFETQLSVDYWLSKKFFNTMKYRIKLQHSNFLRFGKSFTKEEIEYIENLMKSFEMSNRALDKKMSHYSLADYGYF